LKPIGVTLIPLAHALATTNQSGEPKP